MIPTATLVSNDSELREIIALQRKNLKQNISAEEKQAQGFVTMVFTLSMLKKFQAIAPSVIIKIEGKVAAYSIVVLQEGRKAYPDLEPMFLHFESLSWKGRSIYDYRFYAMGQICIDKNYRSLGFFDVLYQKHRQIYQSRFDFIITEISTSNQRSLKAHERVGFQAIDKFTDQLDEWNVVLWDWN